MQLRHLNGVRFCILAALGTARSVPTIVEIVELAIGRITMPPSACALGASGPAASGPCMARQPGLARTRQPGGKSFGDGLPDQLGDIDDQIRSGLTWITRIADLAGADAHDIVQA